MLVATVKPHMGVDAGPALVGVCVNTINRLINSVAGRLVQLWRRAGASQVGTPTISMRFHSVEGRLVQAGAGPSLVRFAHAVSVGRPFL